MPGSPVLHDFLPEFAQVHVHWVHWWCYLTILSSAPLSSFCLQYFPAFQGLFQWVSCSHQVAKSEDYLTHCRIILCCVCVSCSVMSDSLWPHGLQSVHGILQARILEGVASSFSRGSSWPRDWTQVSHIAGRFFTTWATSETYTYFVENCWNEQSCSGVG